MEPGFIFGVLTGAAIAAYTVWDAPSVRNWHLSPVAFMVGCTLVEIPLFSLALRRRGRELLLALRAHWPRLLAFGVLSSLSLHLGSGGRHPRSRRAACADAGSQPRAREYLRCPSPPRAEGEMARRGVGAGGRRHRAHRSVNASTHTPPPETASACAAHRSA